MAFDIRGKIKGDKAVVRALNRSPQIFFLTLKDWLKNERANMLGGKDSKGKKRKGYRDILARKSLRYSRTNRGRSTWSRRVTGLFSGHIPFVKDIRSLNLRMGVLSRTKHQLVRALELLQTGGGISATKQMIVPMYKNLQRIGYTGPWSGGNVKSGLTNKAFGKFINDNRLIAIKKGGKVFYFDKQATEGPKRGYKGSGFRKSNLLFMGLFGVRVKRQLKGQYDFYGRFDRMQSPMVKRGQTAVDRATKKVEKVK